MKKASKLFLCVLAGANCHLCEVEEHLGDGHLGMPWETALITTVNMGRHILTVGWTRVVNVKK